MTFMCPDSVIPDTLFEEGTTVEETGLWSALGAMTLVFFAAFMGVGLMALGFRRWRPRSRERELDMELLE